MKFYSKSIENPFGSPIGSILASFMLPRAFPGPFWLLMPPLRFHLSPFGSRLGPFCLHFLVHFGSILGIFWCSGRVSLLLPLYFDFRCRFGLHFGSMFEAKIVIFSMKNRIVFSIDFLWICAWELICTKIASKIASETKKSIS